MASTFFGLMIAGSGLRAANASLNTAANNISNKDTIGYSRQRVVQQAADPLRTFTTYGCAGAGVKTLAIERIRDEFYDIKYRENETRYGEYSSENYYMQMIHKYFDDDGRTGFSSVFTNMKVSGIQEVLKNAGSATAKKDFIGTTEKLAEYFNTSSANLERLQKDVNDEIKVKVEAINSVATEIQMLNKQINVIEIAGGKANELRDKRDVLVDQLSQIVDVEVTEQPILDPYNPDRETGANRYMVRIAGGQMLVDDSLKNVLECRARDINNKVNQSDIVGLYDLYWVGGDMFNATNSRMGGSLSGLFKLRDGNNEENFQGTVTGKGEKDAQDSKGNLIKLQTVTIEVTAEHLTDLNKCTLAEAGTISIGNQLYRYDGWSFTQKVDADGKVTGSSYTVTLAEGESLDATVDGKHASTGSSIDYKGIPYYMAQMNEWLRLFSQAVNAQLKSGYTDEGNPGCLMFTADYADGSEGMFDFSNKDGKKSEDLFSGKKTQGTYTVSNRDDSYYRMTASNFAILNAIKKNPELLGVKQDPESDGEDQYANMKEVLSILTTAKKLSFRGADSGEFLTCVLGDIKLEASNAETFEDSYHTLQKTLDNQRLSISGVDEDEEALSVVHLQDSYTLACKMISTFSEIYDRLILETGV